MQVPLISAQGPGSPPAHPCPALPGNHAHLELSSNPGTAATTPESAAAPTRLAWRGPGAWVQHSRASSALVAYPWLQMWCWGNQCAHSLSITEGLGGVRRRPLWQTDCSCTCHREGWDSCWSFPQDPQGSGGLVWRTSAPESPSPPLIPAFQAILKVRV